MKNRLNYKSLFFATLTIFSLSCSEQKEDEIIQETWWKNNYIITNLTNSEIIVKSYLSTAVNGQLRIDSIKSNESDEILELGGIGTNEYLELKEVFDSLAITASTTNELLYFSDFTTGTEEWSIIEVNPEIILNYELKVKKE